MLEGGEIEPLSSRELLQEMHDILAGIRPVQQRKIIFRANHVSNQFPLEGILPRDQAELNRRLNQWISACPPDHYPELNPRRL